MDRPLQVLLIDDNPDDRALVRRELERAYPGVQVREIADAEGLARMMEGEPCDVVITDYALQWSDGLRVLTMVKARSPGCPVVMFTGTGTEEVAAAAMKAGLDDYVIKTPQHFERLAMAVRHSLDRVRERHAARAAEERYRKLFDNVPIGLYRAAADGRIVEANPALRQMLGFPGDRLPPGASIVDFFADAEAYRRWRERLEREGAVRDFEARIRRYDGDAIWARGNARVVYGDGGEPLHYEGGLEDVTEHRRTLQALRESEQQLRTIIEAEPECVKLVGPGGVLLQMNAAGLAMIEADGPGHVLGRTLLSVIVPEYREAFSALTESVLKGGRGSLEFEIIGFKGTRRWLETHAVPVTGGADGATCLLGITRDITEQKRAQARLAYLAHHDALTDLPNRVLFHDRLRQALIDAGRHERLVGVMFLDLDRFKTINDTLGHEAGDQLLKGVAERLGGCVRQGDTVARLSGDEFAIVLADMAHVEDAARIAQKFLDVFAQPFRLFDRELYVTPSIGMAMYPFDDSGIDGLLRNADAAMYRAKEKGRNNYQFYASEMTAKAFERLGLENAMRRALERGEFSLDYQPIVRCATGEIAGVEALLRWNNPERGMIPPAQFIPLAEETGLIVPIGGWVLQAACLQLARWHAAGFERLCLAVNLSARQFQQKDLARTVAQALNAAGLAPRDLELEITESTLMQEVELTENILLELSRMNVGISVDDFGTGYSSLSYLKRFPIDTLKIDQSFVRDIPGDADDAAIAQAVVAMAHSLDLHVVAEGVETEEQFAFLRRNACDAMQGYYFSRPLAADALTALLREGRRLDVTGAQPPDQDRAGDGRG